MSIAQPFGSRQPSWDRPAAATVRQVTADGILVTLDQLGSRMLVGPCRWEPRITGAHTESADGTGHTHTVVLEYDDPPAGTRCLVVAGDGNLDRPWIVAFDGWPS